MTAGSNWCDQLDLLIRARTALIWIRSNEEARVEALLTQTANRLQHQLGCWDFINGLQGVLNVEGLGSRQPMAVLQWLRDLDSSRPTLLLVKDFHRFCDDPGIARMLRNLQQALRSTAHTLVLCSGSWSPPTDLDETLTLLDLPLPDTDELRGLLNTISLSSGTPLEPTVLEELTRACSGLSAVSYTHLTLPTKLTV